MNKLYTSLISCVAHDVHWMFVESVFKFDLLGQDENVFPRSFFASCWPYSMYARDLIRKYYNDYVVITLTISNHKEEIAL